MKEKEICASFNDTPQTVKATAMVCAKCLVKMKKEKKKMKKVLNLYNKIFGEKRGRNYIHITFLKKCKFIT